LLSSAEIDKTYGNLQHLNCLITTLIEMINTD